MNNFGVALINGLAFGIGMILAATVMKIALNWGFCG